jgi:hypothetical protein
MSKPKITDFERGVFSAMQYLVVTRHEPTLAKEIAREHGIKHDFAMKLSKETGIFVREMNKFIREELPDRLTMKVNKCP